jgi:hypothetical protein
MPSYMAQLLHVIKTAITDGDRREGKTASRNAVDNCRKWRKTGTGDSSTREMGGTQSVAILSVTRLFTDRVDGKHVVKDRAHLIR